MWSKKDLQQDFGLGASCIITGYLLVLPKVPKLKRRACPYRGPKVESECAFPRKGIWEDDWPLPQFLGCLQTHCQPWSASKPCEMQLQKAPRWLGRCSLPTLPSPSCLVFLLHSLWADITGRVGIYQTVHNTNQVIHHHHLAQEGQSRQLGLLRTVTYFSLHFHHLYINPKSRSPILWEHFLSSREKHSLSNIGSPIFYC